MHATPCCLLWCTLLVASFLVWVESAPSRHDGASRVPMVRVYVVVSYGTSKLLVQHCCWLGVVSASSVCTLWPPASLLRRDGRVLLPVQADALRHVLDVREEVPLHR